MTKFSKNSPLLIVLAVLLVEVVIRTAAGNQGIASASGTIGYAGFYDRTSRLIQVGSDVYTKNAGQSVHFGATINGYAGKAVDEKKPFTLCYTLNLRDVNTKSNVPGGTREMCFASVKDSKGKQVVSNQVIYNVIRVPATGSYRVLLTSADMPNFETRKFGTFFLRNLNP